MILLDKSKLREAMQYFHPTPTRLPTQRPVFIDPYLTSCTSSYDTMQCVLHSSPLTIAYEVIKHQGKSYIIRINGKDSTVSIDLPSTSPNGSSNNQKNTLTRSFRNLDRQIYYQYHAAFSPHTSRSGRHILWLHLHDCM